MTDERLIQILGSVNGTAIDNDDGKPGEYIASICHQAARRLREHVIYQENLGKHLGAHIDEIHAPAPDDVIANSDDPRMHLTLANMQKFEPKWPGGVKQQLPLVVAQEAKTKARA